MAWTSPKTWSAGEVLTASDMNTYVRDNLNALKAPPTATYALNEASDYTITNTTSFTNVDGTNLSLQITTTGGDVLVSFTGTVNNGASGGAFTVSLDGTDTPGDHGYITFNEGTGSGERIAISITRLYTSLSAGTHTFNLRWRTLSTNAIILYAGAGTSNGDVHPQFMVREV